MYQMTNMTHYAIWSTTNLKWYTTLHYQRQYYQSEPADSQDALAQDATRCNECGSVVHVDHIMQKIHQNVLEYTLIQSRQEEPMNNRENSSRWMEYFLSAH